MPETTRVFVAIAIPDQLGLHLTELQQALKQAAAGWRWNSTLPFHTTLVFLGDVRNHDLDRLCGAIAASAAPFQPMELRIAGLGAFPNATRPRVIWAGLDAPDPGPLLQLHEAIVKAATQTGYRAEDLRFHPHVTLARVKSHRRDMLDVSALVERHRGWTCGSFTASEVITFSSKTGPAGPCYEAIGRAPLAGKKTVDAP